MRRRVALLLQTESNDYQELLKDDCVATGARLGFDVSVFSAEHSGERQGQQVREILRLPSAERPMALLVSPVRESTLLAAVRDALAAGVGWVALSRWSDYLTEQGQRFPDVPLFCVMPDHETVGRLQAKQVQALRPGQAEVVYIRGPLGTFSAEQRWQGFKQELDQVSIRPFVLNSDWSAAGGERAMHEWLRIFGRRSPPACMVVAQNDSMAIGAQKTYLGAFEAAGGSRATLVVTGCDGSANYGQRLVKDASLQATVVIPSVSGPALQGLASLLRTGAKPQLVTRLPVTSYPDLEQLARVTTPRRS